MLCDAVRDHDPIKYLSLMSQAIREVTERDKLTRITPFSLWFYPPWLDRSNERAQSYARTSSRSDPEKAAKDVLSSDWPNGPHLETRELHSRPFLNPFIAT